MADKADGFSKRMKRVGGDGLTVDQHFTAVRGVVTHDEFQNGGLAGPCVAHDTEEIPLVHVERNAVEHLDGGSGIGEVNIVEFDGFDTAFKRDSTLFIDDGRFQINRCKHAPGGGFTALELVDEDAEDEHRHRHSGADEQKGHQLTGGDFTRACKVATGGHEETEGNASDGVDHGDESITVFARTHGLVAVGARFGSHPVGLPVFGVVGLNDCDTRDEVLKHGVDIAG